MNDLAVVEPGPGTGTDPRDLLVEETPFVFRDTGKEKDTNVREIASVEGASRKLADARHRNVVADTLLTFGQFYLERLALFTASGDEITGWRASGPWKSPEKVSQITFARDEANMIRNVAASGEVFVGAFPRIPGNLKIPETLGGPVPGHVALFPIAVRNRVVAVLYGDNGATDSRFGDLADVQKVAAKASLALEMLILRAKILFQK